MTQYVINIGTIPNDGTGDPLRTAFNEVNLNFDQVFAAGPVLSNVQIANNTILTTNTNGNLVLAPNGIGVVQANVNIVPNTSNIRNLGAADRRWSTAYLQYANVSGGLAVANLTATGNVTVGGNLSVTGNIIYIGNLITDAKTIQLANTAGTANAADGSGITVGANDNIATMLYSSADNAWAINIGLITPNIVVNNISSDDSTFVTIQDGLDVQGDITAETLSVAGNISGNYFFGNGSQLTGLSTSSISNGTSNVTIPTANGNVSITAAGTNTWIFGSTGTTIFPTLTVTRGDRSGTLTGQALLFGDSTQEAIISTPNGTNDINSSQRFVINPGAGAAGTTGEGGDIYLYAGRGGDAGGSGGDIKIRGGLGPVDGAGGYLDIQGGDTQGNGVGGYIDIRGGQSGNAAGGAVNVYGGYGITDGGAVNITGGISGNGLVNYGNVTINSAVSTWRFDNTGNLALPRGGIVYETNIPYGGLDGNTIALAPSGGTNADQQLLIYPTAGNVDANHLHLTSGNLYNTELYLGNDNLYVKLANTGNVVVNSNDDTGNSAQWTFDTTGNLTTPGGMIINGNINTLGSQTALLQSIDDLPLSFIASGANGSVISYWAEDVANLMTSNIAAIYTPLQNTKTVRIVTGTNGGNIAIYDFDPDGMFTAAAVCATGNVYAGNVSASGNVTGNYILGNGSQLTNLPAPTVTQDITSNGAMSIMTYDGNIKYVSYATVEPASGNITGGNILTGGLISAAGNVTAGNVSTGIITLTNGAVIKDTADEAVAFGQGAGQASQGSYAVAIGANAGNTSQGAYAVAIGVDAGKTNQGINSVAVGINAGNTSQGIYATAVGAFAGYENQGNTAVAIGQNTGVYTQGEHAVAVGLQAGFSSQGISAIAIGHLAGYTSQGNNSIILNATGANLDQTTANTFTVSPVRNDVANVAQVMFYNTTSKEITYGNVISVTGNVTGGNLITAGSGGNIALTGGNITGANVVTANSFVGNGATLSNVATQVTGSWTVPVGNSTQSFTVPINNTYQLWALGNIPNGIIVYNATVSVSNTNVPVIGQQFAWNYEGGGNILMFTSIPAQIIGTAGAISNAAPAVANTNVFTFGINNTSGNTVTVNYGYTKIS